MSKGGSRSGPPRAVVRGWAENLEDARGVAAGMGPQQIAGPNLNHLMGNQLARQTAMGGPGMQNTAAAAQMAQNIGMGAAGGNYNPMMVQGHGAGPAAQFGGATAGPAAQYGGAAADRGDIRNVMAGSMPGQDMSAYMNPYTGQVIDSAMQDMARQRDLAMQGIGDQAARAGAFGGSRHGVAEGEAHRGFADAAANMAGGLRHQGFDTASGLMQQDMNRGMQAGLANQGVDAQIATMNPQLAQQAGLANMGAQNQMNQFNAGNMQQAGLANMGAMNQMGQFNAGQMQQAALANQSADLQGMNLGLQGMNLGMTGANLMGQMGNQQFNQGMQGAQGLGQFGDLFRGINQQGLDAEWMLPQQQQQIRNEAIGLGMGMNTSQQRPDTMGQLIGAGGAVLGGMAKGGVGFFSDRRLKENIVEFGLEPMTGLPWYEFSYLGDPRRFRGVMADDVERFFPAAVHTRDDGYKEVDYDALGLDMVEVTR